MSSCPEKHSQTRSITLRACVFRHTARHGQGANRHSLRSFVTFILACPSAIRRTPSLHRHSLRPLRSLYRKEGFAYENARRPATRYSRIAIPFLQRPAHVAALASPCRSQMTDERGPHRAVFWKRSRSSTSYFSFSSWRKGNDPLAETVSCAKGSPVPSTGVSLLQPPSAAAAAALFRPPSDKAAKGALISGLLYSKKAVRSVEEATSHSPGSTAALSIPALFL